MKKILVISGHPDLNDSFANRMILEQLTERLPEAEFVYLDNLYADFQINIEQEQRRLLEADIIILQYPIFWFAMPSLLQRWIEQVFQHGFSHGSTGDKLQGKKLIASITAGNPESAYAYGGARWYPIEDFLLPLKATCKLCGIYFEEHIFTGGVSYRSRSEEGKQAEITVKAHDHVERLMNLINKL